MAAFTGRLDTMWLKAHLDQLSNFFAGGFEGVCLKWEVSLLSWLNLGNVSQSWNGMMLRSGSPFLSAVFLHALLVDQEEGDKCNHLFCTNCTFTCHCTFFQAWGFSLSNQQMLQLKPFKIRSLNPLFIHRNIGLCNILKTLQSILDSVPQLSGFRRPTIIQTFSLVLICHEY